MAVLKSCILDFYDRLDLSDLFDVVDFADLADLFPLVFRLFFPSPEFESASTA